MRRLLITLLVCLALVSVSGPAFAAQYGTRDNPVTAGASMSFAECCSIAANRYLAAKQQPPTLTNIGNARAAVRASVATGVADPLLVRYWPSGMPTTAAGFSSSQ